MTYTISAEGIVAAAAVLGALLYLGRKALGMFRKVETVGELVDGEVLDRLTRAEETLTNIQELLESELTHNHGSSMKDDVYGVARGLGQMQRVVEDLTAQLSQLAAAQRRSDARIGLVLGLVEREDKQS